MTPAPKPAKMTVVSRILKLACPNCGKQKLFRTYLKQVDSCEYCAMPWGRYKADDGPAWLTIMVLGHIVVPLAVALALYTEIESWQIVSGIGVLSIILVLLMLPFSKAAFLAALWFTNAGSFDLSTHGNKPKS